MRSLRRLFASPTSDQIAVMFLEDAKKNLLLAEADKEQADHNAMKLRARVLRLSRDVEKNAQVASSVLR